MQLWAEFGPSGEGRLAAHSCDRDDGYPKASCDWAAKTLNLSAPSPLLLTPAEVPTRKANRNLPQRVVMEILAAQFCVMADVPAANVPGNPPPHRKSPGSSARSPGVLGPSPYAEQGERQDAGDLPGPVWPISAPPSTSRPVSWLSQQKDTTTDGTPKVVDIGAAQRPKPRASPRRSRAKSSRRTAARIGVGRDGGLEKGCYVGVHVSGSCVRTLWFLRAYL